MSAFRAVCVLTSWLLSSASAFAGILGPPPAGMAAQTKPRELEGVGIDQKLGSKLSIDELTFHDETGKTVHLSDFFHHGHPVLLSLVYFECPNLCTFVLNGMVDGMKGLGQDNGWTPGAQYQVVTVSINPTETPALAAKKKASYLAALGKPGAAEGWHFLTGDESQIKKLAAEVGFKYKYVAEDKQFAHAAAIYALTPEGRLSRYLYGITYPSRDLRLALLEASEGGLGGISDHLLLFCCRYDPKTGKYSVFVSRLMDIACAATVLAMGIGLFLFWRGERRLKGV